MTVRNINSKTDLNRLRAAQSAWLDAEFIARAAFAQVRLDSLDALASQLTSADSFDAAYAIWDDYIDGRRADERFEKLTTAELREQASIFARLVRHLPPKELFALAFAAWGSETFEVFTREPSGAPTGKLGWYRGDCLNIVSRPAVEGSAEKPVLTVWSDEGRIRAEHSVLRALRVALHPVFGRAS